MDAIKTLQSHLGTLVEKREVHKLGEEISKLVFDKISEKFDDQHAKVQESALKLINSCFEVFQCCMSDNLPKLFNKVTQTINVGSLLSCGQQRNPKTPWKRAHG